MGVDLAGGAGSAVELLRDPRGAVGVAGQQDDRGVILGLGPEVDLSMCCSRSLRCWPAACRTNGRADASPNQILRAPAADETAAAERTSATVGGRQVRWRSALCRATEFRSAQTVSGTPVGLPQCG